LKFFERRLHRRILASVYNNEKENWRVLINQEVYAAVKKPIRTETIRLHKSRWFGHVQ
jgi:hypothetical protein